MKNSNLPVPGGVMSEAQRHHEY